MSIKTDTTIVFVKALKMAEGDSEDAWAQVAGKIVDIKDYTKEKELYLSQLLDSINGFAYPVERFNPKVSKFIVDYCL